MKPLTIGAFIAKLKDQDSNNRICFDFANFAPTTFDSYRGYYDELALGFEDNSNVTVKELLDKAEEAQRGTFTGYKGGKFTMSSNTPLWASNYGRTSSTAIVDIVNNDYQTIIVTEWIDF